MPLRLENFRCVVARTVAACTVAACTVAAWLACAAVSETHAAQKPAEKKPAAAAEKSGEGAAQPAKKPSPVVARVGDQAIDLEDHQRQVRAALEAQLFPGLPLPLLEAEVLETMVDKRLALLFCREQGFEASEAEVQAEFDRFKAMLAQQRVSLADFLTLRNWDEAELKKTIATGMVTAKFAQTKLTPALVEKYFQERPQDFDGSKIRVSHIVLRPMSQQDARAIEQMRTRAARLRELIDGKRVTFADAARKYSAGPSRHQGGDLGLIPRRGMLVDAFTDAAFSLKDGEISQPVVTPFGVHLIHRVETQPGQATLAQVQPKVTEVLAKQLLKQTADLQRAKTKVEFTGVVAYRDPKSGELIVPDAEKP